MKLTPLLAAFDQIISLIIFALLAAGSSWLAKRRQGAATEEEPADTPAPAKPAAGEGQPQDLDTILRRLLNGEPPATAKPPPLPPRPLREPSPPESWSESVEEFPAPPLWQEAPPPRPEPPPPVRPARPSFRPRSFMTRTALRPVTRPPDETKRPPSATRPAVAKHLTHRVVTSDGTRLVAQLRHSATARQAFLASQIFGPPKGMEN